ncbi:MAG: dicarboxylate/amino acid:cation symporter [Bdellovibrionaceae bacterium]|nr:dicarboxylate/amino acid:cation symporter [Pseudobdellovibrionaceae bacterium]|tara:strand:- start:343 stop:1596 length:1254 start_codon:yes stop_codon:yes gene_type:complete
MTSSMDMKNLTKKILFGMVLGLMAGLIMNALGNKGWMSVVFTDGLFHMGGKVFLASLKVLVVPLVIVSLICGTAALDDIKKLGRIGGKTVGLYLATTGLAITFALIASIIIAPGEGFSLTTDVAFQGKDAPPLIEVLINIFPTNPFKSMVEGKMLQIIVFAVLFGLSMTMAGEAGKRILSLFKDLNEVIMKMVMMMMLFAPLGVFCLVAKVFATQGLSAILPLAKYFFTVLAVLVFHAVVVYTSLFKLFTGLSARQFFKKLRNPLTVSFSTASSNATLPVTLETIEEEMGVDNSIASFTIPLGATINMDGTAIMQGVATGFIAQAYGIDLGMSDYLMVILTATLASVGTAGVPGVGLIMLAMVLKQVNLPVEGIGLILGVDRLLDMVRTSVNVTGDMMVTAVVAKSEGYMNLETFED